jgi:choline-glycine betaine transporter
MERLIRNLHVLWRAESLIAGLKVRRASRRGMLLIWACLVGLFGVAMLNVAGFLALQPGLGAVGAALLVAAADFLLAVLTIVAARTVQADPELDLAVEAREIALEELAAEFAVIQAEIRGAREDFASIKSTVTSFIHRPLDSPLLAMILPVVKSMARSMRKGKE